jgi:hypothetical protein
VKLFLEITISGHFCHPERSEGSKPGCYQNFLDHQKKTQIQVHKINYREPLRNIRAITEKSPGNQRQITEKSARKKAFN